MRWFVAVLSAVEGLKFGAKDVDNSEFYFIVVYRIYVYVLKVCVFFTFNIIPD